jgi:N-acetylglucosaminyldiphosphoundecaprenol N-acetyl-beta-D-mannosaminyltransferase
VATDIMTKPTFNCCGFRVDALTLEAAVDRLRSFVSDDRGHAVHLCNAWTLTLAQRDPRLAAAIDRADLNLADGMPLVWVARRAGLDYLRQPVRGTDLLMAVAAAGRAWGLRHYLYGSTPPVARALSTELQKRIPGIEIVGVEAPPFRSLSSREEIDLVSRIGRTKADIVWVGLGTPTQDLFVDRFRDRLGLTLVPVGAAFEFIAGTKKRAPSWMQVHGLEWVYRLGTEPGRLWRRYLVGNSQFIRATWRQLVWK